MCAERSRQTPRSASSAIRAVLQSLSRIRERPCSSTGLLKRARKKNTVNSDGLSFASFPIDCTYVLLIDLLRLQHPRQHRNHPVEGLELRNYGPSVHDRIVEEFNGPTVWNRRMQSKNSKQGHGALLNTRDSVPTGRLRAVEGWTWSEKPHATSKTAIFSQPIVKARKLWLNCTKRPRKSWTSNPGMANNFLLAKFKTLWARVLFERCESMKT